MSTRPILSLIGSLLVLFSLSINAAAGLSESEAKAFLNHSGLDSMIESLPETMGQQLNLQRLIEANKLSTEKVQQALQAASLKIQSTDLALSYLQTEADQKNLKEAMTFLASPLGKRITEEERAASTSEAQMEMQAYMMQLAQNPLSAERQALIQTLSDVLNADQLILTVMKGTFYSLLEITEAISPEKAVKLKQGVDAEWNQIEPMLKAQFSEFMIMGAQYSYRNVSDQDIKAYIAFLKTPSGQAYWRAGIEIIEEKGKTNGKTRRHENDS